MYVGGVFFMRGGIVDNVRPLYSSFFPKKQFTLFLCPKKQFTLFLSSLPLLLGSIYSQQKHGLEEEEEEEEIQAKEGKTERSRKMDKAQAQPAEQGTVGYPPLGMF